MAGTGGGYSLVEAARDLGLTVPEAAEPESRFVKANGIRLHYLDWGKAGLPPMLLLHGAYLHAHSWDFFALAMRPHFRVLSLDQRGHGDSEWAPAGEYSQRAYLRDLEGVVEALGLERFTLIGNALGGQNALIYAGHHPERLERLVIVDATPEARRGGMDGIRRFVTGPDELDSLEEFVERAHQFNPSRSKEQLRGSLRNNLKQLPNGKWTWKYDRLLRAPDRPQPRGPAFDLWKLMGQVTCPTLVVRGALSSVFTEETALKMRAAFLHGELVTIEKAGHSTVGDNPLAFEQALRRFLKLSG